VLSKNSRLSSDYEFNRVKRYGRGVTTSLFGLYYTYSIQPRKTRFGIIVTNKMEPRAVYRNRVRRLLRRAVTEKTFKPNFDVVIVAFRRSLTTTYEEIIDAFNKAVSKTPLV